MTPRLAPALLLVASAALFLHGIDWGLPGTNAWHGDSMCHYTLRAMGARFEGFTKYPPLQHVILAAAFAPYLGWAWLRGDLDLSAGSLEGAFEDPVASMTALILITRLVGVAMGVATVAVIYGMLLRQTRDRSAALVGAALFAFSSETAFFSKMVMVDIPMVFWFSLGLASYLRVAERWQRRDALWLGALVALGACTKEQIGGAWVLPGLAMPWLALRGTGESATAEGRAARLACVAWAGLAWALTYGIASKLFLDPAGWAERMDAWLGAGTDAELWGGHPNTLAGQWSVLQDTGTELLAAMGPMPLALALVLALVALLRRPKAAGIVVLCLASYYVFTLAMLRYVMTRFTLPLVLLLAVLGGLGLASLLRTGQDLGAKGRALRLAPALLALAFGAQRSWAVGALMSKDTRYSVEDFLAEELPEGAVVEAYADDHYLPRMHRAGLQHRHVEDAGMTAKAFQERLPDAVVLAPAYQWKFRPGARAFTRWLRQDSGYVEHVFEGGPGPRFLSDQDLIVIQPTLHVLLRTR